VSIQGDAEVQAVRQVALRWTEAVATADVEALSRLLADDIVVIHGNGRTVSGREAVVADLVRTFATFRVGQHVQFDETIIAGDWAFDRARVQMTMTPREGGDPQEFHSRTLTILKRTAFGDWVVARAIGVIEQP
jgi:uncharacterized protein (TIGR02246 family)